MHLLPASLPRCVRRQAHHTTSRCRHMTSRPAQMSAETVERHCSWHACGRAPPSWHACGRSQHCCSSRGDKCCLPLRRRCYQPALQGHGWAPTANSAGPRSSPPRGQPAMWVALCKRQQKAWVPCASPLVAHWPVAVAVAPKVGRSNCDGVQACSRRHSTQPLALGVSCACMWSPSHQAY